MNNSNRFNFFPFNVLNLLQINIANVSLYFSMRNAIKKYMENGMRKKKRKSVVGWCDRGCKRKTDRENMCLRFKALLFF